MSTNLTHSGTHTRFIHSRHAPLIYKLIMSFCSGLGKGRLMNLVQGLISAEPFSVLTAFPKTDHVHSFLISSWIFLGLRQASLARRCHRPIPFLDLFFTEVLKVFCGCALEINRYSEIHVKITGSTIRIVIEHWLPRGVI